MHPWECIYQLELVQVHELQDAGCVYTQLMAVLSSLAERGLVHCDCNEFNVLVSMLLSPTYIRPLNKYPT